MEVVRSGQILDILLVVKIDFDDDLNIQQEKKERTQGWCQVFRLVCVLRCGRKR